MGWHDQSRLRLPRSQEFKGTSVCFGDRGNMTAPGFQSTLPAPNTLLADSIVGAGYGMAMIVTTTSSSPSTPFDSGCNIEVTGTTLQRGPGHGIWRAGRGVSTSPSATAHTTSRTHVRGRRGAAERHERVRRTRTRCPTTCGSCGILAWDGVASVVVANSELHLEPERHPSREHTNANPAGYFNSLRGADQHLHGDDDQRPPHSSARRASPGPTASSFVGGQHERRRGQQRGLLRHHHVDYLGHEQPGGPLCAPERVHRQRQRRPLRLRPQRAAGRRYRDRRRAGLGHRRRSRRQHLSHNAAPGVATAGFDLDVQPPPLR